MIESEKVKQLTRCYLEVGIQYRGDPSCPAWLPAMGQMDWLIEIELIKEEE